MGAASCTGGREISENELPKKLSFNQYFVHKLGGIEITLQQLIPGFRFASTGDWQA